MIVNYLLLTFSVFVASCSQILLKKSANEEHKSLLKEYLNVRVILGYGLLFASTIITIIAFKGIDFKNGPIIENAGYIFVMILSYFFLKEKITKRMILGNILILIGIIVFYL